MTVLEAITATYLLASVGVGLEVVFTGLAGLRTTRDGRLTGRASTAWSDSTTRPRGSRWPCCSSASTWS